MKILKEGNKIPVCFSCVYCECEFETDTGEYYVDEALNGFLLTAKCPNCELFIKQNSKEIVKCVCGGVKEEVRHTSVAWVLYCVDCPKPPNVQAFFNSGVL